MKNSNFDRGAIVRRVVTAGAVWAVAKFLETPRMARVERKINRSVTRAADGAGKSLKRRAARARKNRGLVVAGVAALALAAGLLGRAAK